MFAQRRLINIINRIPLSFSNMSVMVFSIVRKIFSWNVHSA